MPRSRLTGVIAAAAGVAAITGLIYPLKEVMPAVSTGVLYLLAVLLVSSYWGLWLGLATSLASALAFNFFHIPPVGRFTIASAENWVALGVFFVTAVVASGLANSARTRALEASARRREADLVADLARIILGGSHLAESLPVAAHRIAETIGLASAAISPQWVDSDDKRLALPLVRNSTRVGTLLVPRTIEAAQRDRLERFVLPPLTELIAESVQRARLERNVVETEVLRRSDELKTALLRAVSHDLRTPLTAIRTAASVLASRSASDAEHAEMADVIADESERLARLVENLLDLSKLEAGTATPRRDWCVVEELVEAAAERSRARGAQLDVELDPDLPMVRADPAQLERALANLLENASRYSAGAPVSIRAHTHGQRLLLRVTDRGPGIPTDELRHIFEPFYRGKDSAGTGSGLGLAIARGFVEANGGRLHARSLPGQGASFTLELPLEREAVEGAVS